MESTGIDSKKLSLRNNPNSGSTPKGVTPDMITLIAKQQIAKETAEKEQALNASLQEPQGTIAEQLDGQILESKSKLLAGNVGNVMQQRQATKQNSGSKSNASATTNAGSKSC